MSKFERSRDFYKVLQIPRTASMETIKASYRKLALRLHPDMHKDDPAKTAEFKIVSEAYSVLSDVEKKNTYDFSIGIRYNKNRRTPPPKDYRSVKFPPKPKHWKVVWDHKTHYDMHYGDGMYQEVLRQATKRAKAQRLFDYKSPLGDGFTFSRDDPKVKKYPGPKYVFEYEQVHVKMDLGSKKPGATQHGMFKPHTRVMEDLHGRRHQRYEQKYQQEQDAARVRKQNSAFNSPSHDSCVIL